MVAGSRRALWQNTVLPAVSATVLAAFSALYLVDAALYVRVLHLWSFISDTHPFLDMEYVTAQAACWGKGVDVYRINPCDPLGRLHDYSPLWLRMRFLPAGAAWARLLGVAQDVLFAVSLGFLPVVPGWRATALLVAAVASPTVLFAMERGNVDVLMFVFAVAGLACLEGGRISRICGYGVFLLAGLLKFYPLVLFARAVEERPRAFFAVATAACAAVAAYGVVYGGEIRRALANVPLPSDFGDGFSSRQIGDGLGFLLNVPGLGLPVTLALVAAAVVLAARMARAAAFASAFGALGARAASCLVAGALLYCGCFLSGPSVGYRGVVLLLALPGCLLMAQAAAREAAASGATGRWKQGGGMEEGVAGRLGSEGFGGAGRAWRFTSVAIVLAMWNFVPMMALGPKAPLGKALGPLPFLSAWICREALWWAVFTALMAVLFRFAAASAMAAWVGGAGLQRRGPAAAR